MIQLENIVSKEFPDQTRKYQIFLVEFDIDLKSLNSYVSEGKVTSFTDIINNLEKASALLNSYEGKLKFGNYDL